MKSKILIILLITSILLTQCYTQNEYLTNDYLFNSEDDLKKVVLTDGTEREFSLNELGYKIESDSLLIINGSIREPYGNHFKIVTVRDTLSIKEIHSIVVSEFESGLTTASIVVAGLVVVGIIIWLAIPKTWKELEK